MNENVTKCCIVINLCAVACLYFFRRSCKLHYEVSPLKIVKASKQYMYDDSGNEYLDCINNISHGKT